MTAEAHQFLDRGLCPEPQSEPTALEQLAALAVDPRFVRIIGANSPNVTMHGPISAEDIAQQAFLKAAPHVDVQANPGAYLDTTASNLVASIYRHRKVARHHSGRATPIDEEAHAVPDNAHAGDIANLLVRIDLEKHIAELPLSERRAVMLRIYHDLSEENTAQLMGVSVGSVKCYLSRGLANLRRRMGTDPRKA